MCAYLDYISFVLDPSPNDQNNVDTKAAAQEGQDSKVLLQLLVQVNKDCVEVNGVWWHKEFRSEGCQVVAATDHHLSRCLRQDFAACAHPLICLSVQKAASRGEELYCEPAEEHVLQWVLRAWVIPWVEVILVEVFVFVDNRLDFN